MQRELHVGSCSTVSSRPCLDESSGLTTHVNSPLRRLPSLQVPAASSGCSPPRRASDPKGPWPRSRRSLELAAATRRSALRVDRKKRRRVPAAPMPNLAPGEAGHPFRRLQKGGTLGSSWHLQRFQKEAKPGSPRYLATSHPHPTTKKPRHAQSGVTGLSTSLENRASTSSRADPESLSRAPLPSGERRARPLPSSASNS